MSDGTDGQFFQEINNTEAGQLLALGANWSGFAALALQLISLGSVSPSDTDRILSAIDGLGRGIEFGFAELGDLIKQQTHILVETENRDTMAQALARTDTGLTFLRTFLTSNDDADLRTAVEGSSDEIGFFLNLNQTPPDVFFLPGLIKLAQRILA